ncbi:hypothetical protein BH20BAC1_BH20BAC1_17850 [soil metagenome]
MSFNPILVQVYKSFVSSSFVARHRCVSHTCACSGMPIFPDRKPTATAREGRCVVSPKESLGPTNSENSYKHFSYFNQLSMKN